MCVCVCVWEVFVWNFDIKYVFIRGGMEMIMDVEKSFE